MLRKIKIGFCCFLLFFSPCNIRVVADIATDIATITTSSTAATVGYLVRSTNACKQPQKSMQ